jgi:hypothetical protein
MTVPGSAQTDRVDAALHDLVQSGRLDADQAAAVAAAVRTALQEPAAPGRRRWPEIVGYIGGVVTVAAVLLLVSRAWEALGTGGRSGLLAATAVILAVAGWVIGGGAPGQLRRLRGAVEPERRRLVSTLFAGAAVAGAGAVGVAVPDDEALLATGLAGLVLGLAGYLLTPSLLGQLVVLAGAIGTVTGVPAAAQVDESAVYGVAVLAVGAIWVALAWRRLLVEPVAGVGLGFAVMFAGAQMSVVDDQTRFLGYALTAVTAAAAIAVYAGTRRWVALAVGLVALLTLVFEVVTDLTGGSLQAVWAVLVLGIGLLTVSGIVLRSRGRHRTGAAAQT